MKLSDYLSRIGYSGSPQPDLPTLRALHVAHAQAVPFENLDVQLRRPVSMDPSAIYEKLVTRRRGGWCYEQNGLMGWALREIGFDVSRLCAGVMREAAGDGQLGNHLCLRVNLDRPYLVDVGFGGSLLEPLPLAIDGRVDAPYRIELSRIDGGYWRFTEQAHSDPFSFDFKDASADEALLAAKCEWLQVHAESPFVRNLVVQRRRGDTHVTVRGRVLTTMNAVGTDKRLLASADELVDALRENFQLEVPDVRSLWPAICERHEALFGERA
ncbi:N-hydroxyarylamine O-acetyltransferase [Povalibacter uvarum]|uniref:N-hydroxyarylamine O-acetyltransferase n=1 Tax=Povalibacter uvarum TaxID=732238 RepID=A0A841HSM6_9GAMM|nr:arylamine N-acetyltransferase [Povalibacter uvarum]MBB6096391.1 N-hydroxyarylamine O-acetyltransferase [Povalibacter uvarum]